MVSITPFAIMKNEPNEVLVVETRMEQLPIGNGPRKVETARIKIL
jgi:hypothetical protein